MAAWQGCFLLISAIQPHHQVLLSVKKSCAACMLSFHGTSSKTCLKVSFESVREIYSGPTIHAASSHVYVDHHKCVLRYACLQIIVTESLCTAKRFQRSVG